MSHRAAPAAAPRVIAEVGCNHGGDLARARKMIAVAAQFCEADAVKFQKRDPRALLSPEQYDAPHPNPMHAFGDTYGAHREFLELDVEAHRALQQACQDAGTEYSTSVWDVGSARSIVELDPAFLKVPSASNTNEGLLEVLCGAAERLVLYACTSAYPVPFEDIALREIERLVDTYGTTVAAIGFSGHHLGIAADVAALALGASWFERHFTLDRTSKGTDHAASLEPDGMRRLVRDVRNVSRALTPKASEILAIEEGQRAKLKWLGAA